MKALQYIHNLGKALSASLPETEAKKAKIELEEAKKRLSDTRKQVQFSSLREHYDSQVTLASYGCSRFLVYCQGAILASHVTFEYAMISFQNILNLDKHCQILFENESGQIEDFTEFFVR